MRSTPMDVPPPAEEVEAAADTAPRVLQGLRRRFRTPPARMLLAARLALFANFGIMLTGALVRVTGSGLGCSNWPKCETRVVPTEAQSHTFIEFGNRVLTIGVSATAIFAIFCALTRVPYRRSLVWLSVWILGGVFAQAVLGGLSVLYDLDWFWISAHYMVSILLLLVPASILVWKAGEDADVPREHEAPDRLTARAVFALLPLSALTLLAGTLSTAAGPNSGGEGTGDVVRRLDIHGVETLEWIVVRHGVIAGVFAVSLVGVWALAQYRDAGKRLTTTLTVAALLVAAQGFLGLVQYGLHLPGGLVWIHVLLATLTWVTVVWAWQIAGPARRFSDAA